MPERGRVRLRHSLVLRLFALVTVVAVVAVALTAWLTVRTTAVGIREEQGAVVAASARIEEALTTYAATHQDWSEVGPLVSRLAASAGNRVVLTDDAGRVLADSAGAGTPLPVGDSTTIDALDVGPPAAVPAADPAAPVELCPSVPVDPEESALTVACPVAESAYAGPPPGSSPIDPRVVGPFALTSTERESSRGLADRVAGCLRDDLGVEVSVVVTASGRASLETGAPTAGLVTGCDLPAVLAPYPSERRVLARLQALVDPCLARRDGPEVALLADLGWTQGVPRTTASDQVVSSCLTDARRQLLRPYAAPAARVHVSATRREPTTFLDLSPGNRWRIAGVAGLVVLLSLGFAALAGRQLVRPLSLLAVAAGRAREGDLSARADVRSNDEIGRVASAFNTMAERREEAEQLRRAMVADVAHELRNPISTMRGTLEAAQDGLVPVDQSLVASLVEETLLLQHVVEDLRDLAAADSGDLRLARAPVRVRDLLDTVAAHHDGLTVTADDDLVVDGDALRLRQVVGNLVSNAVRHGDGGGVELVAERASGTVEIRVVDHGEGIAEADRPHVFDRFWRADPSRNRVSGGSGLGLAIVRQLVVAHGGTVAVTATPGGGATFVVALPGSSPAAAP
ncbi:sensor histidine kinase [Nocardioides dongxiaopingii]|uniref:sensor histidine kinase n=1 Tax=Nocardioides dongxiaopingii TaxID=2576036 RepID=UPI0010C76DDF|nr:HAMP domain-containing sensor histidine kinase [Nocardioides dongxiaopingii]